MKTPTRFNRVGAIIYAKQKILDSISVRRYSFCEVAKAAGIYAWQLLQIMDGVPEAFSPEVLAKLAKVLDLNLEQLLRIMEETE